MNDDDKECKQAMEMLKKNSDKIKQEAKALSFKLLAKASQPKPKPK
jgi:hypothetical protein